MDRLPPSLGALGFDRGLPITARELPRLPQLPFVFAEILHDERPHVWYAEQPLAGGVDGEAAKLSGDPAAIRLLGDGGGRAAAGEAVEDDIALRWKRRRAICRRGLLAFVLDN